MKFRMAIPYSLDFFFFLSHLLIILHLVEGQDRNECPSEFKCGVLEKMTYPFTYYNKPSCGLCLVYCDEPKPQTNLCVGVDYPDEDWYNITQYSSNHIRIEVPQSCMVFQKHFLPKSEHISFTTASKLTTLLKCNSSFSDSEVSEFLPTHRKFNGCAAEHKFIIYYNFSDDTISDFTGHLPLPCHTIELPLENKRFDEHDFYDILADEISLEWSDTTPLLQTPIPREKEKSHKLGLILGSVLGGIVVLTLIICGIIFIIWRQKKRNKNGTYLLSRNISSDPSSRGGIEVGSARFLVPVYTYDELEKATANFDSANELGDGGFGIVYYGRLKDGREVAVKRLYEHNYKRMEHFMNEINILRTLRHPNLVTLYGCTSRHSRELLLVYEYVLNGTVADHVHGNKAQERLLTWPIRMNIALDTANALAYLHKSDIIHRDVKTNNILLDQNFSVKVADFGLSRLFPLDVTHISTAPQGTPGYVDPEYHECYQLTDKSDVYSFGVVLVELISSLPAVDITRHRHEINLSNLAISKIQTNALDELIDSSLGYGSDPEVTRMTSNIAELAFLCLQVEKELRPSMNEVVEILEAIKRGPDNSGVWKGVGISPSSESDGIGLLKNRNLPPSPMSVTEDWVSGSSTASVH